MKAKVEPGLKEMVESNVHVWVNGEIVPVTEAKISIFDRSAVYGDAVFETVLVTEDRRVFRLKDHIRRLRTSAKGLDISIPLSDEELTKAIADAVRASHIRGEAGVRISISRGVAPFGLDPRNATGAKPTIIVAPFPFGPYLRPAAERGLRAKVVSTRRIPPYCVDGKIKQCNYVNEILAKQEAISSGMDEAIMLDVDGFLAEAPAANIFLVKDDCLYTPRPKHILLGITRQAVMEIAGKQRIPLLEADLTVVDLYSADEAFLTGTSQGIVAIIEVDGRTIGDGVPGAFFRRLSAQLGIQRKEMSTPLF